MREVLNYMYSILTRKEEELVHFIAKMTRVTTKLAICMLKKNSGWPCWKSKGRVCIFEAKSGDARRRALDHWCCHYRVQRYLEGLKGRVGVIPKGVGGPAYEVHQVVWRNTTCPKQCLKCTWTCSTSTEMARLGSGRLRKWSIITKILYSTGPLMMRS